MSDQPSETFSVTATRIEAPWRLAVGWSNERGPAMGRSWTIELPGTLTPATVEKVEQVIRRAVRVAADGEMHRQSGRNSLMSETIEILSKERDELKLQLQASALLYAEYARSSTYRIGELEKERDEQAAKLAEALTDVERLTAVCVESAREINALKETERALRADVADRDRCNASLAQHRRDLRAEVDRLRVELDAPTASVPTVDRHALALAMFKRTRMNRREAGWGDTDGHVRMNWLGEADKVIELLEATPDAPKTAGDLMPLSHVTGILDTFAARLDGHAQSVRDDHDRADECAQADDIDRFEAGAKAVREAAELVRNALAKPAGEEPSYQHPAAAASRAADAPSSPHHGRADTECPTPAEIAVLENHALQGLVDATKSLANSGFGLERTRRVAANQDRMDVDGDAD